MQRDRGIYGVVHGKCLYNFCRRDCGHQVDQLVSELELASQIGCDVVIHQAKNIPSEGLSRLEAIDGYVRRVTEALQRTEDCGNGVLLENSAHQGNELGYALDELAYIYHQFNEEVHKRVGICVDLCHIFVAGELDVRDGDQVDQFFQRFKAQIGLAQLKCIHFNDSNSPFGGCNDYHGDIHCGYISNPLLGGSVAGFRRVSELAARHGIPMVFETPCKLEEHHLHHGTQRQWQLNIVADWAPVTTTCTSSMSNCIQV